jgi:sulfate permease, SulP family
MNGFFKHFRGDLFGGITAGIVALPLALAFGVSSGLGPSAGLYGAMILSFFAALFGGTPTQISGPTAPMTAVSMVIIGGIVAANGGNVEAALPAILLVFLLAGLIQIGLGVAGFGRYIKYIPYPVVSGFMTAIGVMILITQLLPAVGYYAQDDVELVSSFKPLAEEVLLENILRQEAGEGLLVLEDFKQTIERAGKVSQTQIMDEARGMAKSSASGVMGSVVTLPRALQNVSFIELILTLATVIVIYGFKRITTAVPSTLVALLLVSGVAVFGGLDYRPIQEIPSGFPTPHLDVFTQFEWSVVQPYLLTALSLALLGTIDSLLTSVVADNLTKTKHNSNQELIGQGIGNSIGALFGGLPGAGATIRTVVNIDSGGKTRLSGMIAGILLMIVLIALGPVASKIPAAVLAGILITVGIGVMDYKGLKAMPLLPKDVNLKILSVSSEVLIMLVVMLLSVFWDLVNAVGIGLVLSALSFMKKMGDHAAEETKILNVRAPDEERPWADELKIPNAVSCHSYVKHLNGPLFFGHTSEFQALTAQLPATADVLIIRMDRVPYIDQSGLYALEEVLLELAQRKVLAYMIAPQAQPRIMMEGIGLIPGILRAGHVFESFEACIDYVGTKDHEDEIPEEVNSLI